MKTVIKVTTAIAALLVVSACAGGPDPDSFGGRLQAEGGEIAELGKTWTDGEDAIAEGSELIEDGESDIDRGEDLVSSGRKEVRRGEELVRKGERMKREAEEAYRLRTAKAPAS